MNKTSKTTKTTRQMSAQQAYYASPNIDLNDISEDALHIIECLQSHGYMAFIVGGAVRDLLLGLKPKDFDVATSATPEQVVQVFRRARIIGKRFQIVHVRVGNSREIIEVTTFRGQAQKSQTILLKNPSQRKQTLKHIESGKKFAVNEDGQILSDNVWGTHEEDASRRDLTINALYYDPCAHALYDFYDGQADLNAKTIKMIGEPSQRYIEDPMRMLRVARFQAKTGFEIDAPTKEAILELNHLITNIPKARLLDEFAKILLSGWALNCVHNIETLGLGQFIFPWHHYQYNTYQQTFVALALKRSDERLAIHKTVSLSFIFACMFWGLVDANWQMLKGEYQHRFIALEQAIYQQQYAFKDMTHKLLADMHEIWLFQGRLERRSKHTCLDMLEHPRFKAGFDFLELRVLPLQMQLQESGLEPQNPEDLALIELFNWWKTFAEADDKETMLAGLVNLKNAKQRARRKRKKMADDSNVTTEEISENNELTNTEDTADNLQVNGTYSIEQDTNTSMLTRDDYPLLPDYQPEHKYLQ